jgi:O-antigen/teichoic acid export membrane protein
LLKRLSRSVVALAARQITNAVGQILQVPLFLSYWSAAAYGEWLVLLSAVNYLTALDFGLYNVVHTRLTATYARGDLDEYGRIQRSAMAFYLYLACGATALTILAARSLPLTRWLGLRAVAPADSALVLSLLAIQILWSLPLGFLMGVYQTTGDLARTQWLDNTRCLLILGATVVALASGGGIRTVALAQLAPYPMMALYVYWDIRRRLPRLAPRLTETDFRAVRGLIKPSLLFAVIVVAGAITQQGPVLILSSALGGVAVAVFVTSRTLANLVRQIVQVISLAAWPELTRMEAVHEEDRLRSVHRLLTTGCTALTSAVAAALWYEGVEVIAVWSCGKLQPNPTLLHLLLAMSVLQSVWLASSMFSIAANRHARVSLAYLISSVVGIGVGALLIRYLGIIALPIGLILGEMVGCYHFVLKDTCQMLGEPYGPFARRLWFGVAAVAAATLGAGWIAHQMAYGPAVARWVEVGLVTSTTALLVGWYTCLPASERTILSTRMPLSKAWSHQ